VRRGTTKEEIRCKSERSVVALRERLNESFIFSTVPRLNVWFIRENMHGRLFHKWDFVMLGSVVEQLLQRKLTTMKEIEYLTGRGRSTIYRWMRGETQPTTVDLYNLLHGLASAEARHTALQLFAGDLPVVIQWCESEDDGQKDRSENSPTTIVQKTTEALRFVVDALTAELALLSNSKADPMTYARTIASMDEAIRAITAGREVLRRMNGGPARGRNPRENRARAKTMRSSDLS